MAIAQPPLGSLISGTGEPWPEWIDEVRDRYAGPLCLTMADGLTSGPAMGIMQILTPLIYMPGMYSLTPATVLPAVCVFTHWPGEVPLSDGKRCLASGAVSRRNAAQDGEAS